ncbi:MAG TPA: recombinase family protein [Gaiellaceae bacterium]|nr:recombinase family protein [Gaiellaceae bacterium]
MPTASSQRGKASESFIGYVRVSTEEQASDGSGLEAQRVAIRAECERRGWELLRIEQDVVSGRTLNRPGLQRALADCRSGVSSGVVVAKLDRLSRSLIDFAGVLEDARKRGYNVVTLDLGVDLSTPAGEMLANVMATFAQYERRLIGQRTKEALAVKRAEGVRVGRPAVISRNVVTRIKRARGRGDSLRTIAAMLNAARVPTAHGGTEWHASTVQAVLRRSI